MHSCVSYPPPENIQAANQQPVAVLLATYNGERYLAEQIESLLSQTHRNWTLYVSDDGSCDSTLDILERYRVDMGSRLHIFQGPKRGFAANFLSMIADDAITADYFAFCDQDDLWHPDKLERAIAWLKLQPSNRPVLYCSRTRLVSEHGDPLGFSPLFRKPPSFRNAIVQSIAGGNTMVFNAALKNLVSESGNPAIVSHDWWLYMLASGCNGKIFYDPTPAVDYRQHNANLIGSNVSLKSRLKRLRNVLSGHFLAWNEINLEALEGCKHLLSDESRQTLECFSNARRTHTLGRVSGTLRSGIYRQGRLESLALFTAALLRKV
jgi:glycosyltransferase involved in cell wall biosynthesis